MYGWALSSGPPREGSCSTRLHGFTIYDSRAVLLGTQTATAIITDQKDMNDDEEYWAELEPIISYDDAARAAIDRVAADYRSIT